MSGPRVQTFCIDKDSHMDAFLLVNTFKWCFFIPKQWNKILFGPPKMARGYERSRYGYTHMCLSMPAACELDFY